MTRHRTEHDTQSCRICGQTLKYFVKKYAKVLKNMLMIASALPMSNIVGEENDFSRQLAASRAQSVEHGVPAIGVSKKG